LGFNYQDDKVQFGINGFHSHMKNLIFQRSVSPALSVFDNLGELSIFGIECAGKYSISKSLFFEGSFLYQQSKNITSGETNPTPLPNFSAKGGLSYESEFGLTVSGFNTFQQSVDPKYYDTLNPSTKYFNMANIHCSYDLNRLFKIPAAKELSLILTIDNLLDEEVWLPAWGLIYGEMMPFNQGRTIYGGFKVTF
jgi:outer membrane receptor for ferrienterochelin and colicin